jgi:hypothetical protein
MKAEEVEGRKEVKVVIIINQHKITGAKNHKPEREQQKQQR